MLEFGTQSCDNKRKTIFQKSSLYLLPKHLLMALLPTLFKSNFNSIFYRAEVQNQSNPRSYELIKNKKKLSFKLNLFQRPNAIIKALFNRDKKHPFTIECCGPLLGPAVVDQLHTWSAPQHSIVNRCCYF